MAYFNATQIRAKLAILSAAYDAASTGQAYSINGRRLDRVPLEKLEKAIEFWEKKLAQVSGTAGPLLVEGRVSRD
jgi:hypothetical protein